MKLTTKQLKQIIKEELESVLDEGLEDVNPEDWIHVYNGCMGEGVPVLGINAGDEDRCTDLAAQVKGKDGRPTLDYETMKAYLAYERDQNRQEPEEKDAHANERWIKQTHQQQDWNRQQEEEAKLQSQIKEEWEQTPAFLKKKKAKEYLKKIETKEYGQLPIMQKKLKDIRDELRHGHDVNYTQLEFLRDRLTDKIYYVDEARKFFKNIAEGSRLSEPLPRPVKVWIYKCLYEKEDFYCM